MRCAVVRASKGYHISKTVYIYIAKFPSINHSGPSVMSNLNQVHHLYFSIITQSISTSINFTVKTPNPCNHYCIFIHIFLRFHPWTILVLYSCHPGGTTLELYIYIYSKWVDTVPLSKVRGQFPSLVTPWEGNPNLSPIRKGAVSVSNQMTAGHSLQSVDHWSQSPICQPVQITVDWPIERLSSCDGT